MCCMIIWINLCSSKASFFGLFHSTCSLLSSMALIWIWHICSPNDPSSPGWSVHKQVCADLSFLSSEQSSADLLSLRPGSQLRVNSPSEKPRTYFHHPRCSPAVPGHLGRLLLCTSLTSDKRPHGAERSRQEGRGMKGENVHSPLLEPNLAGCPCWPFSPWNSAAQWYLWSSFLHSFRPLQPPSAPDQHLNIATHTATPQYIPEHLFINSPATF